MVEVYQPLRAHGHCLTYLTDDASLVTAVKEQAWSGSCPMLCLLLSSSGLSPVLGTVLVVTCAGGQVLGLNS